MLINDLASNLPLDVAIVSTVCLTLVLLIISVVDLKTLRIPDVLSLPLIAGGLSLAFVVPGVSVLNHVAGALAAYLLFAGLGEIYFRSRGVDGLGLGDAKLFAGAGAWLGWQNLPVVLLLATAGGLVQALLWSKVNRSTPVAFGPYIALAFWTVWISTFWGQNGLPTN